MRKLTVIGSDKQIRVFAVARELSVGRSSANDIQIAEKGASRKHCRLRLEGDVVLLDDLNSANGTLVNGEKIATRMLKHGDTIAIGDTTLIYEDPEAATAQKMKVEVAAPVQPEMRPAVTPVAPRRQARAVSDLGLVFRLVFLAAAIFLFIELITGQIPVNRWVGDLQNMGKPETPASSKASSRKGEEVQPPAATPPVERRDLRELIREPSRDRKGAGSPTAAPEPSAAEDLAKALAARDHALETGNLLAARAPLQRFLVRHPPREAGADIVAHARRELLDTEKLIQLSLDTALKQAQQAVAQKKYQLASQRCTSLLSSDPSGKFGALAQALLTQIDKQTKPRFEELSAAARKLADDGKLDEAGATLAGALDELAGTRWAGDVSTAQLEVLMARALVRQMEAERVRQAEVGLTVPVKIPSKKLVGALTGLTGLSLEIKSGKASVTVPLRSMETPEVVELLKTFGLADHHVELAYLWLLLGRKDAAQAEAELALQQPGQTGAAARLLPTSLNLRVYDFSDWAQQTDWEALSGSWLTQDQKYVLEAGEGGDTALKPERAGGPFATDNAHLSFDFELLAPREGWFFACELAGSSTPLPPLGGGVGREGLAGAENSPPAGRGQGAGSSAGQSISVIFSAEGFAIQSNLGAVTNESGPWALAPTHVALDFKGDTLALSLNGLVAKTLAVEGLPQFKGGLIFRVREAGCALDNVVLRGHQP